MKVATWNLNSIRSRLPQLMDWLSANPVDVLAVQETKCEDLKFPFEELATAGWIAAHNGQKSYNGVAILSPHAVADVSRDMPAFEDPQKRVIAATVNGLRVVCAYVVNGQSVGSEKYAYKLRWLEALRDHVQDQLARHPQLVLLGDFNIVPTVEDSHDPAVWEGGIFCTEAERARYHSLLELGLTDCLAARQPPGNRFTWWDYRQAAFRRGMGLRIDHILASAPLSSRLHACRVDLDPRRQEKPSDHAPVIAEFLDG